VAADWTLDTNVLIYAIDHTDMVKWAIASDIGAAAENSDIHLPRQAIGEFFQTCSRKQLLPRDEAYAMARRYLAAFDHFQASDKAFVAALDEAATGRTQFWDAVLLASCAENGIKVLLTEDMAQGTHPLGVEIVNPFKPSPSARKTMKKLGIAAR
jgi:predicted nucleic acid-binding protein